MWLLLLVTQGVLEQTVESLSMPLAMMPTAQEMPRSASAYSAVVGFRLPLTISRGGEIAFQVGMQPDTLQCRQFYHALVLHKHRQDLLPLLLALRKQCAELRRKVSNLPLSVFEYCQHYYDSGSLAHTCRCAAAFRCSAGAGAAADISYSFPIILP